MPSHMNFYVPIAVAGRSKSALNAKSPALTVFEYPIQSLECQTVCINEQHLIGVG